MTGLAKGLFVAMFPVAVAIWVMSARQFRRGTLSPALRPMLAMHLAPAALFAIVATATGLQVLATGFATLTLALLISLIIAGHWLTVNGFTPLWSAFTFPLAASAAALLALDETRMFQIAGAVALIAATFAIPVILALVLRQWMTGQLPTILSAKST